MTMHMVHPGLTTINTSNRKKKPGVKQTRAMVEHEEWLKKQGLHRDQLEAKKTKSTRSLKMSLAVDRDGPQCGNGFAPGGLKKSVFDTRWNRAYDNDPQLAAREAIALKQAEELKSRLMPLYNKGPVQLNTNLSSLKDGNGRGKR